MSSREQQAHFEAVYERLIAGAQTDEEELLLAHELLAKAQAGWFPLEDGRMMSLSNLAQANRPSPGQAQANPLLFAEAEADSLRETMRRSPSTWIGAIFLLAAACVGLFTLLPSQGGTSEPTPSVTVAPGNAQARDSPTPEPTPTLGPTPTAAPLPNFPTGPTQALAPISVEVGSQTFPIYPTRVQAGLVWAYVPDPAAVSWLEGSYLNTVLALPWSEDNLALVEEAQTHGQIVVRFNTGQIYTYYITSLEEVDPYQIELLRQGHTGLTLILVAPPTDSDPRMVLRATWQGAAPSSSSTRSLP